MGGGVGRTHKLTVGIHGVGIHGGGISLDQARYLAANNTGVHDGQA